MIVDFPESGSRQIDRSSMTGKRSFWDFMRHATGGSSGGGLTEGGELQMADRLVSWVERYFTQTHTTCTAVSTTTAGSGAATSSIVADTHITAATTVSSSSSSSSTAVLSPGRSGTTEGAAADGEERKYFLPPLYFQHQGHSRTITGR